MFRRLLISLSGFVFYSLILTSVLQVYLIESKKRASDISYSEIKLSWRSAPIIKIHELKHKNYGLIESISIDFWKRKIRVNNVQTTILPEEFKSFDISINWNKQHIKIIMNDLLYAKCWFKEDDIFLKVESIFLNAKGRIDDKKGVILYQRFWKDQSIKGKILLDVRKSKLFLKEPSLKFLADTKKGFLMSKINLQSILPDDAKGVLAANAMITWRDLSIYADVQSQRIIYSGFLLKNLKILMNLDPTSVYVKNISGAYDKLKLDKGKIKVDLQKTDLNMLKELKIPFTYRGIPGVLDLNSLQYKPYEVKFNLADSIININAAKFPGIKNVKGKYNLDTGFAELQANTRTKIDEEIYEHAIAIGGTYKEIQIKIKGFLDGVIKVALKDKIQIDLTELKFKLPINLGVKPKKEKCIIYVDFKKKTIELLNKQLQANLTFNSKLVKGVLNINQALNKLKADLKYDLNKKVLYLNGSGEAMNGKPWLDAKIDPTPSMKMHVELHVDKMYTGAKDRYLKETWITLDNTGDFPDVYIVGEPKGNKNKKDADVYVYLNGPIPNRKILIHTHVPELLCKTLDMNLPMKGAKLLINGLIRNDHMEGFVQLDKLYMTKGLGVFRMLQFLSIGHWVNTLLQPNADYWPWAGAHWKYYPQEKLELKILKAKNAHYEMRGNGLIDMKKDNIDLKGHLTPKTLLQRLFLDALNTSAGIDFRIFGDYNDPQVQVNNKVEILPFFLP